MDSRASNLPCSELRPPAAPLARSDTTDGEQLEVT